MQLTIVYPLGSQEVCIEEARLAPLRQAVEDASSGLGLPCEFALRFPGGGVLEGDGDVAHLSCGDSVETAPAPRLVAELELDGLGVEICAHSLQLAAAHGELHTAELLLAAGVPVDQFHSPHEGTTALMYAAGNGHDDAAELLLRHGADCLLADAREGDTALLNCAGSSAIQRESDTTPSPAARLARRLLRHGSDIEARNLRGFTPLLHAAYSGADDVAMVLLDEGADPHAVCAAGSGCLMHAFFGMRHGGGFSDSTLQALLSRGADPNQTDPLGHTVLREAVERGARTPALRAILAAGGDPNRGVVRPLQRALQVAHDTVVDVVAALLEHGADPSGTGDVPYALARQAPISLAASAGLWGTSLDLLRRGAQPNALDDNRSSALMHATRKGKGKAKALALALLAEGCGVDVHHSDVEGVTALMCAAESGSLEVMQRLVYLGAGLDTADEKGNTALHVAAKAGHMGAVTFLLDRGADHSRVNGRRETVMILVGAKATPELVARLISLGGDVRAKDVSGRTVMHTAPMNQGVVEALLSAGADATAADSRGATLLLRAAQSHTQQGTEVAAVALRHGASPNTTNKAGETPLQLACGAGNAGTIRLLLQHGAGVDATALDGSTALMKASACGSVDAVRVMLQAGASLSPEDYKGRTCHSFARGPKKAAVRSVFEEFTQG